jgi:hypothetical protein
LNVSPRGRLRKNRVDLQPRELSALNVRPYILLLACWACLPAFAQVVEPTPAASAADSSTISTDPADSLSIPIKPKRKSTLDHEVNYQSADSMTVDLSTQKVYLYGDAVALYDDIELKASYIEISLKSNELHATGLPDSTGEMAGLPLFTQGDQTFRASEMRYNFKSKRGLSKDVKTQESGGFLHGETVKRDTGEIVYIRTGMFTTCEYDEPHFHIHAGKLKVIPQDKIVTGPAYLTIAGIPTPLALPFGYFPNTDRRANGILLPKWGDSRNQGFSLNGGGYYFGVGDHMDFSLTADIYTRGGWAANVESNYGVRYKFRGNYRLNYTSTVFSEKGYPDYSKSNTFNVKWSHNQDPKARPGSTFLASIDAGSSKGYRNNLNSTSNDFLKSQLNSSIRYGKTFENSPFNFGVSAAGSQNTQSKFVSIRAPQATLTMARIFPFQSDVPRSSKSFISRTGIDKIGIAGSADFINRLEGKEDTIFNNYDNRMWRNMQNGLKVAATAGTNVRLFKYITFSPNTTHKLIAYRKTYHERWNPDSLRVDHYFANGLSGFYDGKVSANLGTVVYGTYVFKSESVKAMRHQVTPNVSMSYSPDYSDPMWGYYGEVQVDTLGNTESYSYFENGVFGDRPQAKENGVLSLSLNNTFELKVRNRKDSTGKAPEKKIKLVDAFGFNTNYNIAKDSLHWSPLNIQFRTQVIPGFVINASAILDPYALSVKGKTIDRFQYEVDGSLGRWSNARLTMTYNIRPGGNKGKRNKAADAQPTDNLNVVGYYTDFIDYSLPWNMNVTYNIIYTDNGRNESLSQIVDLNGQVQLTRNWQIGYRTGIDIIKQEITYSSFDIYRDLHCWEFSLRVIPFGPRQSYNFQINVKQGMLEALKIPRNRQYNQPVRD